MSFPEDGACPLSWQGETLWLLPERAVFWPRASCLLVADAHFGKSALFRHAGLPLPPGTTTTDKERLQRLVSTTRAREILFLGDTLHAPAVRQAGIMPDLQALTRTLPARCVALPGNHDERALSVLSESGFAVVPSPMQHPPFLLQHEPPDQAPGSGLGIICGHLHPGWVSPPGTGPRWRAPCFWLTGHTLHLPAFGSFTGLATVTAQPGDRIFVVTPQKVVAVRGDAGKPKKNRRWNSA